MVEKREVEISLVSRRAENEGMNAERRRETAMKGEGEVNVSFSTRIKEKQRAFGDCHQDELVMIFFLFSFSCMATKQRSSKQKGEARVFF